MVASFLLGVIFAFSLAAGMFFLKFWRDTHDFFFFAFAVFFFVEGANRLALLFFTRPNEGSPWIYIVRLFALLLILGAILNKNYGRQR
jgi:uncharacterized membrane protein HdeD (DUF308 family)